jgi:hypothetical protein
MSLDLRTRHFLGVERSATDRAWRDRLDERGNARALAMVQRYGLPELLARVVAGRGIGLDEVQNYLEPSLKRMMPDPFVITDMSGRQTGSRTPFSVPSASPSSVTTTSTARPVPRCSRASCARLASIR